MDQQRSESKFELAEKINIESLHNSVISASEAFWTTCESAEVAAVACFDAKRLHMCMEFHTLVAQSEFWKRVWTLLR